MGFNLSGPLARLRQAAQAARDERYAPDIAALGLVPDEEVSAEEVLPEPLAAAVNAAAGGDWVPAASLLRAAGRNWDLRYYYVKRLGKVAADDDRWLTAWRAAQPGAVNAAAVHAESLVHLAWEVRSGRSAQHVSNQQFATFHRILAEAETAALHATTLLPDDPTPWVTLITICRGLGYDADRWRALWAEVTARAPYHRPGHETSLQYWCKKWHGSHEQMFAFAARAASLAPSLTPLPLGAAFEYWVEEDTSVLKSAEMQAAADVVLRDWLSGAGADTPWTVDDRSLVAITLTFGGRAMPAVEQFRLLGTRGDSILWQYFGDAPEKFLQVRNLACIKAEQAMFD